MHLLVAFAVAVTLSVPDRRNATPTVAADGTFVTVVWGATLPSGVTDIFAAVSRDGAHTFGSAVRVNQIDGDARVNGEQPPRVALVKRSGLDPSIVVVWTTKGRAGTKLVMARSSDGGKSFSTATTVPESDAAGNRGWQNLLAAADGKLFAIWLDHREMADHTMGTAPQHAHGSATQTTREDGAMMAQKSKLYVGTIDGGTAPRPVVGGVCYCCKTAIAQGRDGTLFTAWRHVYPGNFRDMAMSVSRDGGRTFAPPVRVSEDQWMLEGCPDDGPAVAVDARNVAHIVWPTLVSDQKTAEPTIAVFYASTRDGKSFTTRKQLPTEGVAHHPQIVIGSDGMPVIIWDEAGDGARRIVMASGPQMNRRVLSGPQPGVYPSIASTGSAVVVAWTATAGDTSRIEVHVP
jgi:hypothetical protein